MTSKDVSLLHKQSVRLLTLKFSLKTVELDSKGDCFYCYIGISELR